MHVLTTMMMGPSMFNPVNFMENHVRNLDAMLAMLSQAHISYDVSYKETETLNKHWSKQEKDTVITVDNNDSTPVELVFSPYGELVSIRKKTMKEP